MFGGAVTNKSALTAQEEDDRLQCQRLITSSLPHRQEKYLSALRTYIETESSCVATLCQRIILTETQLGHLEAEEITYKELGMTGLILENNRAAIKVRPSLSYYKAMQKLFKFSIPVKCRIYRNDK